MGTVKFSAPGAQSLDDFTVSTFSQIAMVGRNLVSYVDSTVVPGSRYCYRVRAYNTVGNSDYSNEACATAMESFVLTVSRWGTAGR